MPVRFQHDQQSQSIYFITFTCIKWKNLFQIADAWNAVYKWFDAMYAKGIRVNGYVIMPNHVHCLLNFPEMEQSLNAVIGNAKRFMAYEIVKRLKDKKEIAMLEELHGYVKEIEMKKGQIHKVFENSFDAKECRTREFIGQKLDYIHRNPVSKKWQLVNDYADYPYSSAAFYEKGIKVYDKILHVTEVW